VAAEDLSEGSGGDEGGGVLRLESGHGELRGGGGTMEMEGEVDAPWLLCVLPSWPWTPPRGSAASAPGP
jgi:hypothetical protein